MNALCSASTERLVRRWDKSRCRTTAEYAACDIGTLRSAFVAEVVVDVVSCVEGIRGGLVPGGCLGVGIAGCGWSPVVSGKMLLARSIWRDQIVA